MFVHCKYGLGDGVPLLKEAFSLCKSVDSDGIYTWYSFIGNIFKELDLEITDFENFTRPFAFPRYIFIPPRFNL
jgi:hypothetical protein